VPISPPARTPPWKPSRRPTRRRPRAFRLQPLHTKFRPNVPYGAKGWGKDGVLDLAVIEKMTAAKAKPR
jgi:hypothetical protein